MGWNYTWLFDMEEKQHLTTGISWSKETRERKTGFMHTLPGQTSAAAAIYLVRRKCHCRKISVNNGKLCANNQTGWALFFLCKTLCNTKCIHPFRALKYVQVEAQVGTQEDCLEASKFPQPFPWYFCLCKNYNTSRNSALDLIKYVHHKRHLLVHHSITEDTF